MVDVAVAADRDVLARIRGMTRAGWCRVLLTVATDTPACAATSRMDTVAMPAPRVDRPSERFTLPDQGQDPIPLTPIPLGTADERVPAARDGRQGAVRPDELGRDPVRHHDVHDESVARAPPAALHPAVPGAQRAPGPVQPKPMSVP